MDTHEGWLLILDNVDDLEAIRAYLPSQSNGQVLLTTRTFSTGTIAHRIELSTMTLEEGTLFLLRRMKNIPNYSTLASVSEHIQRQARAIVEELGALPLALDQAGAYIEDTWSSLAEYLKLYQVYRQRLLRKRGQHVAGHPDSVAVTWALSFDKIKQANPAAVELLRLLAFLHPDLIPESLIVADTSALGLSGVMDAWNFNEAVVELLRYSLIKRNVEEKTLTIHRLVQTVIQDEMTEQEREQWIERTVAVLNAAFPNDITPAVWAECGRLLPHVLTVTTLPSLQQQHSLELASLLHRAATYLCEERTQSDHVESLFQRTIAIREQQLGLQHPDTATSLNGLATFYYFQAKYKQAEPLFQRAKAIREQQLGLQHPDTAESFNNLGILYQHQEQYEQAEQLFQQALAMRKQLFGFRHSTIAASLNSLGLLYFEQGKHRQARSHHLRAMAMRKQLCDPLIAESLNNLGLVHCNLGKFESAERLFQGGLAISEHEFGPYHPDTAQSLNNLASLYYLQGNYAQARPGLERALAIRQQVFVPQHPDIAQSLNQLGTFAHSQEQYEQAEALFQQALAIRKHLFVPRHRLIAESLNNLGVVYYRLGQYKQARPFLLRAIAIRKRAFGPCHAETSKSLNHYLALLAQLSSQA